MHLNERQAVYFWFQKGDIVLDFLLDFQRRNQADRDWLECPTCLQLEIHRGQSMFCRISAAVVLWLFTSAVQAQVVLNQVDNFESGIANWENNAGLASVQLGGPGGGSDHFLQLASNGSTGGPGSLLVGFNQSQWIGDYVTQGITAIEMDLKNINYPNAGAGMSVRIVFRTGTGGASTPAYVSNPLTLLADNSWHHAVFQLDQSQFTAVGVPLPPSFSSVIGGDNMDFRILHNPVAAAIGASTPPVAAQLGIDNIRAVGVPEPCSLALCGIGFVAMTCCRAAQRLRLRHR